MRRDQKLTLRQIAAREGCGVETARRDINRYMADLDRACLEGAAAIRAEEYERLDKMASQLEVAIDNGDLSQVPAALKASESIRKLYALDVQPFGRTELALRRAVVTEIATKLRDQLPPETFAEVAILLTDDESIQLLDGVAVAATDEEGTPPLRFRRQGQSDPQSAGQQATETEVGGSGCEALPVVVSCCVSAGSLPDQLTLDLDEAGQEPDHEGCHLPERLGVDQAVEDADVYALFLEIVKVVDHPDLGPAQVVEFGYYQLIAGPEVLYISDTEEGLSKTSEAETLSSTGVSENRSEVLDISSEVYTKPVSTQDYGDWEDDW